VHEDPLARAQEYANEGDHAAAIRIARDLEAAYAGDLTMLIWVRLNLARWLAVKRVPDRRAALGVLDAAEADWRSAEIQNSEMVHMLGVELMSLRSFVLRQLGHAADGLAASERALKLFGELEETLPPVGRVPILLNEGAALADLGRTAASLEPLTQALDVLRTNGSGPVEVEIELLVLLGTSLTLLGRFDDAEAVETEAIGLAEPRTTRSARHLLAAALNNYATTLTRMRRLDEALVVVTRALGVLEEGEIRRRGIPLTTRAEILLALGRKGDAAQSAREAEPIMREYAAEVPMLVASSLANVCLLIGEAEDDPGYAHEALERFTALKEQFPGRYDYWWRRASELAGRLGVIR
jgi:tetratricopeptide (TPR) repeat protein